VLSYFSVVMATYGRGRHILPSIRSVLGQGFADFELIIVGDACTDETEAVVRDLQDLRIRWLNLGERCGSQSGPNNAGVEAARGSIIAYLGHDDIWEPDHLERLAEIHRVGDRPDFAVSGSIFHLPHGIAGCEVMGIFPDGADVRRYFFPPSSFSHRKDVVDRIGLWRMPMDIRAPVDEDFLMRAMAAGLRFQSTGVVTLHKFAAGHRYLSYLRHSSEEQEAMLAALTAPGHAEHVQRLIAEAKASQKFMPETDKDFDRFQPGELAQKNAARKGLQQRPLQPLSAGIVLRQIPEPCEYDWKSKPVFGLRFSKANPRPRFLLPVTGRRARLRLTVAPSGLARCE
jgi:Glycosyl transferase family 2